MKTARRAGSVGSGGYHWLMSPDQPTQSESNQANDDLLNKLEEAVGYLEVDGTRAREQFDELSKAVHELSSRMQRLEARMMDLNSRIETPDPGLVAPPHSAGPDITRDPL